MRPQEQGRQTIDDGRRKTNDEGKRKNGGIRLTPAIALKLTMKIADGERVTMDLYWKSSGLVMA